MSYNGGCNKRCYKYSTNLINNTMIDKITKIPSKAIGSNDFYKLLCAGLCLECKHKGYKSDEQFQKTGRCMKKFWMDKQDELNAKKPVTKCKLFEPCA